MKPALSFAQILEEKLAAYEPGTDVHTDVQPFAATVGSTYIEGAELPSEVARAIPFDWNQFVKAKLQSAYPQTKSRKDTPPHSVKVKTPRSDEREWPLAQLSTAARLALQALDIATTTISPSLVKKAYRRLALRLHPDAAPAASSEAFLLVQEAYEILTRELEQLGGKK